MYRLAKRKGCSGKDIQQVSAIKNAGVHQLMKRRKEYYYFQKLMNEENERERRGDKLEGIPVIQIS